MTTVLAWIGGAVIVTAIVGIIGYALLVAFVKEVP